MVSKTQASFIAAPQIIFSNPGTVSQSQLNTETEEDQLQFI